MPDIGQIWSWLDGRKSHIAHAYWAVLVPASVIWWPEGIPPVAGKVISIIGIALTAFGYGHKALKNISAKP